MNAWQNFCLLQEKIGHNNYSLPLNSKILQFIRNIPFSNTLFIFFMAWMSGFMSGPRNMHTLV